MSVKGIFRQLTRAAILYTHAMLPVPWPVIAIYVAADATAGLAIGAAVGWLISRYRMGIERKILTDAILGSLGFLAGFTGCTLVPWPQNTIIEPLSSGGTVATTMNRYQHPERVAVLIAVLLPLLYELSRRRKRESTSLTRDG